MSWATSAFRWIDTEYLSLGRSSILRWSSGIFTSYLTPGIGWIAGDFEAVNVVDFFEDGKVR
uniref:Uncharacterized protein n=1 Tax=Fagus sylvatica TaxID=28930 RepID=A0A2N9JAA3_FAGSY